CRGQRRSQEPGTRALEHAGLVVRRVLRRWCLAIAGRRIARLCAALVPRRRLPAAAEQAAEEAAALLRCLLRRLMRLLQLPLQALDAVLRLGQRMFLHEGELGDPVAGLRVALELFADQAV